MTRRAGSASLHSLRPSRSQGAGEQLHWVGPNLCVPQQFLLNPRTIPMVFNAAVVHGPKDKGHVRHES